MQPARNQDGLELEIRPTRGNIVQMVHDQSLYQLVGTQMTRLGALGATIACPAPELLIC